MQKWAIAVLALAPPWAKLMYWGAGPDAEPRGYSLAMLNGQPEEALIELHRPLPVGNRERHVIE